MNELLAVLQTHFPDVSGTIKDQLAQDPTFQDISENYSDCVKALRYWRQSKAPEAEARVSEYQTIARELEQEMFETFAAVLSQSRG